MWKLPDGKIIRRAQTGRMFQLPGKEIQKINGKKTKVDVIINHPERNLEEWSKQGCLLDYGVYNYVEKGFNKKYYSSTGQKETKKGDTKTVTHTVKPRFKLKEIQEMEIRRQRSIVSSLFVPYQWFYERAQDGDHKVPEEVVLYKKAVRSEYDKIEKEIKSKKYDDVVKFQSHDRWPDPPSTEDPIN